MWVPLGDVPECSHNVTIHGLSKLSKDLLLTWGTPLFKKKNSWFIVTCLLDLKSPIFPCAMLFFFYSLLGSLCAGRQMNLRRTWQVVILLWFLFVSVYVCLIFDASWCECTKDWDLDFAPERVVFQEKGLVPGEHLESASWLRTPKAQFQKMDEEDRIWVRSTAA